MKRVIPLLMIAFFLPLCGCKREEPAPTLEPVPSTTLATTTTQSTTESTTAPEPRERHEYNKHNPDKNLFLQYLNDEIPLVFDAAGNKAHYFSYGSDDAETSEMRFYIVDMDGDGKPEFCYRYHSSFDIIRYNEEKSYFELWFSGRQQCTPLGNGKIHEHFSSANMFADSYQTYDNAGNLIESITLSRGVRPPSVEDYFAIDYVDVTEEEWSAADARMRKLFENAPKALSYQELLDE